MRMDYARDSHFRQIRILFAYSHHVNFTKITPNHPIKDNSGLFVL